jgi:hypothetical protein
MERGTRRTCDELGGPGERRGMKTSDGRMIGRGTREAERRNGRGLRERSFATEDEGSRSPEIGSLSRERRVASLRLARPRTAGWMAENKCRLEDIADTD